MRRRPEEATVRIGGTFAIPVAIRSLGVNPAEVLADVCFAHREPEDLGPFRQFFRAPLVFDTEQSSLVFSAAD